jgi:hypothetical protein
MHSCTNEDTLLGQCLGTLWVLVFGSNGEVLAAIASECPRQHSPIVEILARCIFFNSVQIVAQIRIRVREAMRIILKVIVIVEHVRECEGVVVSLEALIVTPVIVLDIVYIFSESVPAQVFLLLGHLGETQNFHAVVIK